MGALCSFSLTFSKLEHSQSLVLSAFGEGIQWLFLLGWLHSSREQDLRGLEPPFLNF